MPDAPGELKFTDTLIGYFDIQAYSSFIEDEKDSFEAKLKRP